MHRVCNGQQISQIDPKHKEITNKALPPCIKNRLQKIKVLFG